MKLLKFLTSKTFFIQLILAIVVIVVGIFFMMNWLESTTNHNEHIEVPDLTKMTLDKVDAELETLHLQREILDSANYNPNYPKYSVIEQVPAAGKLVKENRKIYLTLNPSGYAKIEIPSYLLGKTRRQVAPTLRSLGFEIGEISYRPDIARDAVLEMRANGETINAGDKLMKTTKIDLILGDGKSNY